MKFWQKISTWIIILILGMVNSCSSPERKTALVITFDVEDYISPESERIDEIPKWLATIMSEEGVTGTFFVIGEKARSLEQRGRGDVIAAMARHDIGSHTNFGSIHPTVTEQLEKADWEDGVSQMTGQESAGIMELERIFGKPVATLARHGGSYGPQLIYALGRLKAGYVGSPVNLPGRNVVWFCNALNFYGQYDGFDNAYFRDDLFEPLLEKLKAELTELPGTVDAISLFAGHPCKIRTKQFWDFNFYDGENRDPSQWKTPDMRPLESMKTAQNNFRRLIRVLKEQNGIEITTFHSLMELYSFQKEFMTKKELHEIAEKSIDRKTIMGSEYFSPAEAFFGYVKAIQNFQKKGSLPGTLKMTERPLGPLAMPLLQPETSRVTLKDIYDLAGKANDYIEQFGSLPSSLDVGNSRIGTGSLFALFSAVYLDMRTKSLLPGYDVPSFDPYPRTNEKEIIERIENYKSWPVHRPDLEMSDIVEITRLQLWTLKPAQRR